MYRLLGLFFSILLLGVTLAPAQEVRFICQKEITSGEKVPIIVRFYDHQARIDSTFSGTVLLTSSTAQIAQPAIRVIRGSGSVTTTLSATSDFVLEIAGHTGSKTISVVSGISYTRVSGRIDDVENWTSDQVYRVDADLKIVSGGRLTIGPGTRIYLDNDVNIVVEGGLRINGNEESPVVFHPYDASAWGGIEWVGSQDPADLKWTIFTGGGGDQDRIFGHSDSQPVVKVISAQLLLDNCFFIDNEGKAIGTHESVNTLTNCLLSRCDTGAEFRYSTTQIDGLYSLFIPDEDELIEDDDNDGLYFWSQSNTHPVPHQIKRVVIYGVEDDGIDFNSTQQAEIHQAFIGHVYDKGISTTGSVNIQVTGSIFAACGDYGIAFKDDCEVVIDHSTFYGNKVDIKAFNPDMGKREGRLDGANLIFAHTVNDLFDIDSDAEYSIRYAISNTDPISGTGNIFGDPLLTDPSNLVFSLQENSPAIDAGDPDAPPDPDGSRSDMGAVPFDYRQLVKIIPTEIDYRPMINGVEQSQLAFVEIYNDGPRAVDLSGFELSGDVEYRFPESTFLSAGSFLLLVKDAAQWNSTTQPVFEWTSGMLDPVSGQVILSSVAGAVVFHLSYQNQAPWPIPTSFHHYTLSLISTDEDYADPENWALSQHYGGTPGWSNEQIPIPEIIMNELMADNQGSVNDESGNTYDWIEILNVGETPVNLAGLLLSNDPSDPDKYRIPNDNYDETTLAPNDYFVFWASSTGVEGWNYLDFPLNNSSGQLLMSYATATALELLDQVYYSGLPADLSYARIPDSGTTWIISTVPTPGTTNRQAFDHVLEGLLINEFLARNSSIYADESGVYSDWIELFNTTTEDIDLAGLYLSDDPSEPLKYRIPGGSAHLTTIPALGYILFRADARPENGPLHADFQLASNGETVSLSQFFNGTIYVLDQITYSVQYTDISYGRFPDGTDHWEYFNRPTPLAANSSNSSELFGYDPMYPLEIYPNPVKDDLYIRIGNIQAVLPKVTVHSMQGRQLRIIQEAQSGNFSGGYTLRDSLSGIPSGTYYLLFTYPEALISRKIVVLR